jgi:SAM-dependent methyltransferase
VTGPPDLGAFTDVDRSAAPEACAGYLDAVRALPAVAEWKERSFALMGLRAGATVADLGCGTGDDVLALALRVAPGGRVLGVDASAAMVREARRRAAGSAGVEIREGDARALDLPDGTLDACRAERVLLHMRDPAVVVAEMARVLAPGGRAVVADPDWGTLAIDAPDPEAGRAVAEAAAGRFLSPRAGRSCRRLLVEAGLADVEVHARTLVTTDGARAEQLFALGDAADRAVAAGLLEAGRAAAWRAGVARRAAEGTLLVAMTAFMAAGRREDPTGAVSAARRGGPGSR